MDFGSRRLVLLVLCATALMQPLHANGCVTDQGKIVDWYVALRVPNSRTYLIYEPKSRSFRKTTEVLLQKGIAALNEENSQTMLWNDQTSTGNGGSSKAHAKGILHFNPEMGGFFMVHSIPHFVDISNDIFDPATRETSSYGQSIACVSLNSEEQAQTVIDHVLAQNSYIYYNTFEGVSAAKPRSDRLISDMPSDFLLVTKTSVSREHPFEDLLREEFETTWLVSTWGRPYKESDCGSRYKISNVLLKTVNAQSVKNTQDHSKWAISYGDTQNWVCVGDLNHMDSQATRGGSFLCKDDVSLHHAMLDLVVADECDLVSKAYAA